MQNDKRLFLAFGITMVFLYVWFGFIAPKPAPSEPVQNKSVKNNQNTQAQTNKVMTQEVKQKVIEALPTVQLKTLQNDQMSVRFSSKNASVDEIVLKKYKQTLKSSDLVKLSPFGDQNENPSELKILLNGQEVPNQWLVRQSSDQSIEFENLSSKELNLVKQFTMTQNQIDETVSIQNKSSASVTILVTKYLQASPKIEAKRGFLKSLSGPQKPTQAVVFVGEEDKRWDLAKINSSIQSPVGNIEWAGFDTQYFILGAFPKQGQWEKLSFDQQNNVSKIVLQYPQWTISPGQTHQLKIMHYAGPKEIGTLKTISPNFDHAIDLGSILGTVARPMLTVLKFFHRLIPNYGIAIILLTIFVRLLLFPLTQMQGNSMKKMQSHKPQMDAMKEKFGDDKERYSRELMSYMRTHKINPAGGCLLLLPQLPIFFALYRVLYNSIELRHEPFFGWIRDLSSHDPFFVLPVLLGIAMYFQQKLTPQATVDPAQQTVMKIMPFMFTFLMIYLPAGLNLYILVSTLWGVAQQYWIQRQGSLVQLKKAS